MIIYNLFQFLAESIKELNPSISESKFVKPKGSYLTDEFSVYEGIKDNKLIYCYSRQVGDIEYSFPENPVHSCEMQNDVSIYFRCVIGAWNIDSTLLEERLRETLWLINFRKFETKDFVKGKIKRVKLQLTKGQNLTQNVLITELGGLDKINMRENLNFAAIDGIITFHWLFNECNPTDLCIIEKPC